MPEYIYCYINRLSRPRCGELILVMRSGNLLKRALHFAVAGLFGLLAYPE